jgi:putative ABC transport system ATP-binding protein
MLTLKNITKVFNEGTQDEKHALDDFSLEVADGDFITIIGSNGAGKTTLLNVIAGTEEPDEGQLIVDNQDVTKWPDFQMAKYISRVFQSPTMGTAGDAPVTKTSSGSWTWAWKTD